MDTKTKIAMGISVPILVAIAIIYMTAGGFPVTSTTQVNYVLSLNATNSNTTTVTLTVTGAAANITLTTTGNKTHTTISANNTYWADFTGSEDVLITITKDSSETQSWRFDLNFTTDTSGGNNVSTYVESRVKSYPHLLFSDVTQTPGYINNASEPWNSWYATILAERSYNMVDASLLYLINPSDTVAKNYVRSHLVNYTMTAVEAGPAVDDTFRGWELMQVCIAYDWGHGVLNETEDVLVRDKIAILADQVWYDEQNYTFIAVHDFQMRTMPALGCAGALLDDYTNTSLNHSTIPANWTARATYDIFVNDTGHPSYNTGMLIQALDQDGRDLFGTYRYYYYRELTTWAKIYGHYYNTNLSDTYPIFKKWMLAPMYNAIPLGYETNYITAGNFRWGDPRAYMDIIGDAINQSYLLNYYNLLPHVNLLGDSYLPNSREFDFYTDDADGTPIGYVTYPNLSITPAAPSVTSRFLLNSDYQVFRSDWSSNATWLSFTTWNTTSQSERDMAHADTMSIDYSSRGEYPITDSGEIKHIIDPYGGTSGKGHNTILVSDNTTDYPGGIIKGGYMGYYATYTRPCSVHPWQILHLILQNLE